MADVLESIRAIWLFSEHSVCLKPVSHNPADVVYIEFILSNVVDVAQQFHYKYTEKFSIQLDKLDTTDLDLLFYKEIIRCIFVQVVFQKLAGNELS